MDRRVKNDYAGGTISVAHIDMDEYPYEGR